MTPRRLGNEPLFQQLGQENVAMLNMAFGEDDEDESTKKPKSAKKIVSTCPHCFNTIANEYPQLGGDYESSTTPSCSSTSSTRAS